MYEGYGFLKNLRIPSNSKTSATCMKIKGGRVQNVIYPPALGKTRKKYIFATAPPLIYIF